MQEFAEARLYELWLKEKRLATRAEVGLVNTEEVRACKITACAGTVYVPCHDCVVPHPIWRRDGVLSGRDIYGAAFFGSRPRHGDKSKTAFVSGFLLRISHICTKYVFF